MIIRKSLFGQLCALALCLSIISGFAAESESVPCFNAKLIWSTDNPNVKDPKLKRVDPKLVERFKKVFKWKYYYKINEEDFCVPIKGQKKISLSKKCEIEVRDLGKPMIEVKLFGKGNLVKKIRQASVKCLVIAGDDKDDTAWFVVLIPK